ncbi:MAG: hypothetical protein AAFR81_14120 [Chloroflexota bacterium]
MLKIIVDFNNLTSDGEKVLVAQNRDRDTEIVFHLRNGMRVLLHELEDFEVEAVVKSEEVAENVIWWYAIPDWSTRHDFS